MSDDLPDEIISSVAIEEASILADILQVQFGKRTTIKHKVTTHRDDWLSIANLNANNALSAKLKDSRELQARFEQLKQVLAPSPLAPLTVLNVLTSATPWAKLPSAHVWCLTKMAQKA